jgi:flotillin
MNTLLSFGVLGAVLLGVLALGAFIALTLRRVVATNEVHIVQTGKQTIPYGKGEAAGNSYYDWPAWLPLIGLTTTVFPVSVFTINLKDWLAYDKDRVPFRIDVTAFFRISDPNTAAQRVANFDELEDQLTAIVQGAARTVLAAHDIDKIMLERSTFGEQFTTEVTQQLVNWGVESVKNIELMDIRDDEQSDSKVIHNIMAKRVSFIEKESRAAVAENHRQAETAEIEADREVELRRQEAAQQVGQRTAEKEKAVGLAQQASSQEILTAERETKTRAMAVAQVEHVRTAEINKEVNVVKAEEQARTAVIKAEGEKQQTVTIAEGKLEAKKREAEGIEVEGLAEAEAKKAMALAPGQAQIVLAKEIGTNQGYQAYLINMRQIEANQEIGIEAAQALQAAGIKVIVNSSTPTEGVQNVMGLFTPQGGAQVGAMLEAIANTDAGKKVVEAVTGTTIQK